MKQISQENLLQVLTEHEVKNCKVEKIARGLYSIEAKNVFAETIKQWAETSFGTCVSVSMVKKNVYHLLFVDYTLDTSVTELEKRKEELIKKIMGGSTYSDDPRISWTLSQNR
jgi:hypothetical protein